MLNYKECFLSQCYGKEYKGYLIEYNKTGYRLIDNLGYYIANGKQYSTLSQAKRIISLYINKGGI